jgi:hypothetical protein
MRVKKWLLLHGIALGSRRIAPGDIKRAAAVVTNFAHTGLTFRDGTAMSASEATHAAVLELLIEAGIGFADSLIENTAEGRHWNLCLSF